MSNNEESKSYSNIFNSGQSFGGSNSGIGRIFYQKQSLEKKQVVEQLEDILKKINESLLEEPIKRKSFRYIEILLEELGSSNSDMELVIITLQRIIEMLKAEDFKETNQLQEILLNLKAL